MNKIAKPFHFKQFSVKQDKCGLKVGTDGVLLGAWSKPKKAKNILDIGTGSGLIALMIAQKSSAQIKAIDIELLAYEQAAENFYKSPWSSQLFAEHISLEEFAKKQSETFDHIICNPPFFSGNQSNSVKDLARNQKFLKLENLFQHANSLLNKNGVLEIIIPFDQEEESIKTASVFSLHVSDIMRIKGKPHAKFKRSLIRFNREKTTNKIEYLCLENETRHDYSKEYLNLVSEYLLIA